MLRASITSRVVISKGCPANARCVVLIVKTSFSAMTYMYLHVNACGQRHRYLSDGLGQLI